MQTNNLIKSALMCGLLLPLTLSAQNLTVTSNTTVSGTHYENNGVNSALINTSTWTFTGSDVILTGTGATNGRIGANFTGGGQLNLSDSQIDAVLHGIQLTNTSAATLADTVINSSGYGVNVTTSSTLTMTGGTITTGTVTTANAVNATQSSVHLQNTVINASGFGVSLTATSSGTLNNVKVLALSAVDVRGNSFVTVIGGTLSSRGNSTVYLNNSNAILQNVTIDNPDAGNGIYITNSSTLAATDMNIKNSVTNGFGIHVLVNSHLTMTGGTIAVTGTGAYGIQTTDASQVNLQDVTINSHSTGVSLSSTSTGTLNNVSITTQNTNAHGVSLVTSSTLTMVGGTITTGTTGANGINAATASVLDVRDAVINAYNIGVNLSGTSSATLNNVNITTQTGHGLNLATSSTVTVTGGTIHTLGNQAHGVYMNATTGAFLHDVNIAIDGTNAHGVWMVGSSTLSVTGGTITANGPSSRGLSVQGTADISLQDTVINAVKGMDLTGGGSLVANRTLITARDDAGINAQSFAIVLTDGTINSYNRGINMLSSSATLGNVSIITQNTGALGINADASSTLSFTNGSVTTASDNAVGVRLLTSSTGTLSNVDITTGGSGADGLSLGSLSTATVSGGTITVNGAASGVRVDNASAAFSSVTVSATGNGAYAATLNNSGTLTMADNSTLRGDLVNTAGAGFLNLNNSTFTGASSVTDSATLTLNVGNNAVWNVTGSSSLTTLNNSGTVIIANALGEDLNVSGAFTQDADGTLDLTISGTGPIVNAGTASLDGTLRLSGFSGTVAAKASLLTTENFTVIHTASGISGDFSTVDIGGAGSGVDYVTFAAGKTNSDRDYTLSFSLSWFADGTNSHGNFTLNNSGTFEVDVVLSNTTADSAKNWDGESLTKLGDGTLLLSATNTYTGSTNISAGTLRAGAADVIASSTALNVSGEFDLNNNNQLVNNLSGSGTVLLGTGTLTVNESDNTTYSGVLNNSGALVKNNTGTLTLSGSSNYAGGSVINSGEINLTNLNGVGTGTVNNLASLRLGASGTFKNNVSGSGVNTIAANGVSVSGNNSTFTGMWDVTGSGTMTSQNNLGISGSTAVNIAQNGALSLILGTGDYHFDQPLTGSGFLLIQNTGNISLVPSVPLVTYVPAFTGTVALERNTLALTAANALPLSHATLVTGTNNLVVVDSDPAASSRNIGGLSFSGGTIRFEGYDPHATIADTIITLTDRALNVSGGGTVEVIVPDPSRIPDGSVMNRIPLLQQDEGVALTQLISATNGVTGSPATLALRDTNGRVISDSYTLNLSHDGVTTDAVGTYDYLLSSGTAGDGLYVAFGLKQADIQAGRTLKLDQDTPVPARGDDFSATITGSGNLQINATTSITLNGTGNSYSGTTIVNTGTLIVGIDEQMFASSTAFVINSGAALNTGGFDQRVNNLSGSGLATFTGNTLTVNNSTNTSFSGTLSGGKLVKDGGAQLNANDAVANLTQVQVENGSLVLGTNANVNAGAAPAVVSNGGTATFNSSTLSTSGSVLILAKDNSPAVVNLNNMSVSVSGNGHLVEIDKGTLTVNLDNTVAVGDVSAFNGSTGLLNLSNSSTLTGRIDPVDVIIDNTSSWNMTGNSSVVNLNNNGTVDFVPDGSYNKTLTVTNLGGNGTFKMNVSVKELKSDYMQVTGVASGSHQVQIKRTTDDKLAGEKRIELPMIGVTTDGGVKFSGQTDVGMRTAKLQLGDLSGNHRDQWFLVLNPDPNSGGGKTGVLDSNAMRELAWFDNDTLLKRMGELRLGNNLAAFRAETQQEWDVWVRGYGAQTNVGATVTGHNFQTTNYGSDIGADHAWQLDSRAALFAGVFAGYGKTDLDMKLNGGDGHGTAYRAGVYATWIHDTGWYADAVLRAERYESKFTAYDTSRNSTTGKFDNWTAGASLELGRQFQFEQDWYVEPQIQASYARFFGTDYNTGGENRFAVHIADKDVAQLRFGATLGRTIRLGEMSILQPYIKVAGIEQMSNGGKLSTWDGDWRTNFDGPSAVVGAGLIWQLDANNQLHLDYESQFSTQYDKPWNVNLGYRYQF